MVGAYRMGMDTCRCIRFHAGQNCQPFHFDYSFETIEKVVARNETVVSDSLNEAAVLQSRSEKEQNHRSSKEMDTHRVSGYVLMIFIIILFFYIIRRK